MSNYLETIQEFTDLSCFSEAEARQLELKRPGWLMKNARAISEGEIDTRLTKRGDVPFTKPYPSLVKLWVADLLTPRAYRALGVRPTDEQQISIDKAAERADAAIRDAADPVKGLRVLPLRQGATQEQATEPATYAYSEQSPFTSRHTQFDAVRDNKRYG